MIILDPPIPKDFKYHVDGFYIESHDVVSPEELMERAVREIPGRGGSVVRLEGFIDHPDEFKIEEHEVDRDHWANGFARLGGADVAL